MNTNAWKDAAQHDPEDWGWLIATDEKSVFPAHYSVGCFWGTDGKQLMTVTRWRPLPALSEAA